MPSFLYSPNLFMHRRLCKSAIKTKANVSVLEPDFISFGEIYSDFSRFVNINCYIVCVCSVGIGIFYVCVRILE